MKMPMVLASLIWLLLIGINPSFILASTIIEGIHLKSQNAIANGDRITLLSDSSCTESTDEQKHQLLKPFIAPAILISSGTLFQIIPEIKENIHGVVKENFSYHGSIDDYLQYAPFVSVYLLNFSGIEGKNNFGNRSVLAAKSILLSSFVTSRLKIWTNVSRPNDESHSFPSGHTTVAFTFAHFMHKEFGDRNIWYSIGAYTGASAVGIMRMAKSAHWLPDVLMGAGVGMLSTELAYITHQYKWDNEHLKRLDIFPFSMKRNKGVTLVYTF